MDTYDRLPRFLAPDAAGLNTTVTLPAEQSHHLTVVLRIAPGDQVRVFTGQGQEFVGRVQVADPRGARVHIEAPYTGAAALPAQIVLAFAPAPGQRNEVLVEKATELGAAVLQPLLCERLQGFQAESAARRAARWRGKAQQAARQSQRTVVPEVMPPVPLETFLQDADYELALVAATASDARPLWDVLAATAPPPPTLALLVGPAGGFTRREHELAVSAGFTPVSLGPHTLRVETAALSLLSVVAVWLAHVDPA